MTVPRRTPGGVGCIWPTTGWCAGSGGPLVFVDEAAEDVAADDASVRVELHRPGEWLVKPEAAVGSRPL